ncbi:MAG: efflux RND transporter permease subunit [Legionellales bacterium]|nr:efflux RND transporter permease subunit [Legionellales bacterium]
MKLTEICIKQPVLAIVLNLVLVVVGIVGYHRLEIRFFPDLREPLMNIGVHYEGADPKLMENSVTTLIENSLAGVDGIQTMTSSSSNSWSRVYIRFRLDANFEEGVNEVRDKIAALREKLPADIDPPSINVGGNDMGVLSLGFIDPHKTAAEIRDYVRRYVWPKLRQIPGVGGVDIYGASDYALRIWLNADELATRGVTATDVKTALQNNNIDFPAGSIKDPWRNYSVISATRLSTPEEFKNVVVYNTQGLPLKIRDIADVELGYTSLQDAPMRINGQSAIDVEIKPLQSANPIQVANLVKHSLEQIRKSLPATMSLRVNYDQSLFLASSIHETFHSILEAVILVMLVVFLFLGSLRASSIPIVTIPLCLISVFGLMYLLNFTINVMTLLALVLAIGLVVDDAIVMLENIHRHIEAGEKPFTAAIKGSREIATAVIAMTITLAAVYAPIGFAQGYSAVIFKEFAFSLAGAVIISGWVALTLSPMMCSRILTTHDHDNKLVALVDKWFDKIATGYQRYLALILNQRLRVFYGLLIIGGLGLGLFHFTSQEFIPKEDVGLIQTSITSPTGSSLNYTDKYMRDIEKIYANLPGVQSYYSMISSGGATSYIALKPWGERTITTNKLLEILKPQLKNVPGIEAYPSIPDPVSYGEDGSDVTIQLTTAKSYDDLIQPMQALMKLAKANPGLSHVETNLKYDDQQFELTINRELAGTLHVNIQDIANTIAVMLGGSHVTDLFSDGYSYEVLVQTQKKDLENFKGIDKLYVRSGQSTPQMIPLSSLVKLTPKIGQPGLPHFNRMRAAALTANLNPGYSVGQAVKYFQSVLPSVLNKDIDYAFAGKAAEFIQSSGDMIGIFLLAIVFIYLVLAAQFGSFIDPFIILLTVPLSIVGALICLKFTGGTINLYTEIGFVTLIGMISKHGILITQFANSLRQQGVDMAHAIIQAAATRLRPILMTTAAMVLGTLPLAFASGPGSVGRQQIGWVIVGGLLFGTFFSLIVVPIAYSYFGRFKRFDDVNNLE